MSSAPHTHESVARRRSEGLRPPIVALILGLSCALAAAATWGLVSASGARAAGGSITATEGAPFSGQVATITASQCVTAPVTAGPSGSVAWGDGQTSPASYVPVAGAAPPQYTVGGSHAYGEEGGYTSTVNSTYTCGGSHYSSTVTFSAQVIDAPLSATAGSLASNVGQQFSAQVATFTDADPAGTLGDYSAQIAWGDGTAPSAGIVSAAGGAFAIAGSHRFASAARYTVTVTISDTGGASTVARDIASVGVPPPPPPPSPAQASFSSSTLGPALGRPVTFSAAGSRSPGTTVKSFAWAVNGAPQALCAGATSQLTTRFLSPGTKSITLAVTDSAGNVSTVSHEITVTGRPFSARRGELVMHAQQVFTCQQGPGDPHGLRVAPIVLNAPGGGCTTQLEAGIIDAVGCLTEYQDPVDLFTKNIYGGYLEQNLVPPQGSLTGVPNPELGALLSDINQEAFPSDYLKLCALPRDPRNKALTDAQMKYCGTVAGSGEYVPPSISGSGANGANGAVPFGCASCQHTADSSSLGVRDGAHPLLGQAAAVVRQAPVLFFAPPCDNTPTPAGTSGGESVSTLCLDLYVSTGPVRINGIDYVPDPGTALVISPQYNLVVARSAIWLDNIKLHPAQPINYQLPSAAQGPDADYAAPQVDDIRSLTSSQPAAAAPSEQGGLGSLGHFPSVGALLMQLKKQTTYLTYQVQLPPPFTDGNGNPVTATVYAQISNTQRFQVLYAELGGPADQGVTVHVGPATLKNFSACFRAHAGGSLDPCPYVTGIPEDPSFGENFWDASGELDIGSASLVFRPTATALTEAQQQLNGCPARLRLGIGFSGGSLAFAGAVLNTPNATIAGSVKLTALGAAFDSTQPNLATLCGFADFTVGNVATIEGRLFGAYAAAGHPYQFTGSELGTTAGGQNVIQRGGTSNSYPLTNDIALGVGGTVGLNLPSFGMRQVGDGYALYTDDPAEVSFGANVDLALPSGTYEQLPKTGIAIRGNLYGAIGLNPPSTFDIQGSASVVARFYNVAECGDPLSGFSCETTVINDSVQAVVSRSASGGGGVAVCGSISFPFPATGGVGYHWGDDLGQLLIDDVHTGGCDWVDNEFVVNVAGASRRQALAAQIGSTRIRVRRGTSAVDLYLTGQGGAPDVTISGPGRVRASTHGVDGHAKRGPFLLAAVPPLDRTYVTILEPKPGTYTIAPNAGSARIVQIRRADGVVPAVAAQVTGRGMRRRLVYDIKREPGQRVVFAESSAQVNRELGSAKSGRGSFGFVATPGHQRRRIVAEIFEHGVPQTSLAVASYAPAGPTRLGRVRRVNVRRAGAAATITFTNVPGARKFAVYVMLSDGARISYVTTQRRVTYRGLFPEVGGLVTVRAIGDGVSSLTGRARTGRLLPAVKLRHVPGHG